MNTKEHQCNNIEKGIEKSRREFFRLAITSAFATPMITSIAVGHFTNKAYAQMAYTAPEVLSVERSEPDSSSASASAIRSGTISTSATYVITFSQPINTSSLTCCGGSLRGMHPTINSPDSQGICATRGYDTRYKHVGIGTLYNSDNGFWNADNTVFTMIIDETEIQTRYQSTWGGDTTYNGPANYFFSVNWVEDSCSTNDPVRGVNGLAVPLYESGCFDLAASA